MLVNQNGDEIEEYLFIHPDRMTVEEVTAAVLLLAQKFGFAFWRTNATDSGRAEIVLRADTP